MDPRSDVLTVRPSQTVLSGATGGARSPISDTESSLTSGEVRHKAAAGVLLVGLRAFAVRGIGLLGSLVLARLLVPEDFGLLAFGTVAIVFGTFLADAGIAAGLVRRERPPERPDLQNLLGFQLLVAGLVVAVVTAVGLPGGRPGQVAAIMTASVLVSAFRAPAALVLERRLDYRSIAAVEVLEGLIFTVWSVGSVALGAGVWGVATAHVVRALAGSVLMTTRSPVRVFAPRLRWGLLRELLGYGLIMQAGFMVNLVRVQAINLTTAAVAGLPVLGLYSLADRIMQIPWLVFESILRVTFPAMARLVSAGTDVHRDLERGLRLLTVLAGPLLCLVGGTAPVLVPVLFGGQWAGASGAVPLIALGLLVAGPVVAVGNGYLYAAGAARQTVTATILHTVVWFPVAVPLLPALGATAVGAGLLVGFTVEGWYLARTLRRHTGLHVYRILAPASLSLVVAGALGWTVAGHLEPHLWSLVQVTALTSVLIVLALAVTARRTVLEAVALGRRFVHRPG